ncbi:LOG family protein [Candidatus Poribacteria bacterium]|nr:LOG family protein [Candidatus Poribacteria bacterium]
MWNSKPVIAIFGSSQAVEGDADYEQARLLGRLLARSGFVVCNGGYTGVMEATARGASEAHGVALGLTLEVFGDKESANPFVTREIRNATLFDRLANFVKLAEGFMALKGGVGTLAEFSIVWSLLQIRAIDSKPFVFIGRHWTETIQNLRKTLEIREKDIKLFHIVSTPEEAVEMLKKSLSVKK